MGLGDATAGFGVAAAAGLGATGWIDTYRPSQIIGLGSYFHGVKNRFNCVGVSLVFGGMS